MTAGHLADTLDRGPTVAQELRVYEVALGTAVLRRPRALHAQPRHAVSDHVVHLHELLEPRIALLVRGPVRLLHVGEAADRHRLQVVILACLAMLVPLLVRHRSGLEGGAVRATTCA